MLAPTAVCILPWNRSGFNRFTLASARDGTAHGGERFQRQDRGPFFGDMIYDRVVPADPFLRKLEESVPWDQFTRELVKLHRGKARQSRPPYDPAVVLKMLVVAYLYNLSERQTEVVDSDSLSIKRFLGSGADKAPPDHSTLTAFKRRLIDNGQVGRHYFSLESMARLTEPEPIMVAEPPPFHLAPIH